MMNNDILYDLKLENGEIINSCYFIKEYSPVRGGKGSPVLYYSPIEIILVLQNGEEIKNIDLNNSEILDAYDSEGNNYMDHFREISVKINPTYFPIMREVRYLN